MEKFDPRNILSIYSHDLWIFSSCIMYSQSLYFVKLACTDNYSNACEMHHSLCQTVLMDLATYQHS